MLTTNIPISLEYSTTASFFCFHRETVKLLNYDTVIILLSCIQEKQILHYKASLEHIKPPPTISIRTLCER